MKPKFWENFKFCSEKGDKQSIKQIIQFLKRNLPYLDDESTDDMKEPQKANKDYIDESLFNMSIIRNHGLKIIDKMTSMEISEFE